MVKRISNFYFYWNLVQPKITFKLNDFSLLKKKKNNLFLTSFWKSYSRFSHELSSNFWIRISTFKKIKNKILLKNFILALFSTENWFTFSNTDIVDQTNWNLFSIWKNLKKLVESGNEKIDFSIFSTNKIFNKIFKNFISLFLNSNWTKSSIFLEKYFLKEKYTWALSLTNNLKFYFIKFFLFYLPSAINLKKINFLNKNKSNFFFLKKLNNFIQLFTNKRYFIFFNNKFKLPQFKDILNSIVTNFLIVDFLIFFKGNFFYKSDQNSVFSSNLKIISKNLDEIFVNFFIKINKTTFLAFVLQNSFLQNKNTTNLIPLFFNEFIRNQLNSKINLIKLLNYLIKLRITFFSFLFFFFKKIIFYRCQLLNN